MNEKSMMARLDAYPSRCLEEGSGMCHNYDSLVGQRTWANQHGSGMLVKQEGKGEGRVEPDGPLWDQDS